MGNLQAEYLFTILIKNSDDTSSSYLLHFSLPTDKDSSWESLDTEAWERAMKSAKEEIRNKGSRLIGIKCSSQTRFQQEKAEDTYCSSVPILEI